MEKFLSVEYGVGEFSAQQESLLLKFGEDLILDIVTFRLLVLRVCKFITLLVFAHIYSAFDPKSTSEVSTSSQ